MRKWPSSGCCYPSALVTVRVVRATIIVIWNAIAIAIIIASSMMVMTPLSVTPACTLHDHWSRLHIYRCWLYIDGSGLHVDGSRLHVHWTWLNIHRLWLNIHRRGLYVDARNADIQIDIHACHCWSSGEHESRASNQSTCNGKKFFHERLLDNNFIKHQELVTRYKESVRKVTKCIRGVENNVSHDIPVLKAPWRNGILLH